MISGWTTQYTKFDVMERLGAAKIPVGAVLDTSELQNDPFLREHEMFVTVDHPTWGELTIPGSPIRLSRSPVEVVPAPLLGEGNEAVYGDLLELSKSDLEALRAEGVI